VIYYEGAATSGASPADVTSVSEPAKQWDGAIRRATLDAGSFTSTIDNGADELPKSQLAGSATLADEQYICFVDGQSQFQFREGLLGLRTTTCRADFWCASLGVGK
jgi:hypothetical protein